MGNMGGNFANSSLREDKMRTSLQKGERGGKTLRKGQKELNKSVLFLNLCQRKKDGI